MADDPATSIPFSFFVSLLREIAALPAPKSGHPTPHSTPADVLSRWVSHLRRKFSPLPPRTTAAVFRLLFPEDDPQRKYELQETRLASHLAKIYAVSTRPDARGAGLRAWDTADAHGCLGGEVYKLLDATSKDIDGSVGSLTITQVDSLLTELATTSAFSGPSIRGPAGPRRTRQAILTDLFNPLPALDAAYLTQIILKDLRPLLYPLPADAAHSTVALLAYKSNSAKVLTRTKAMRIWDPSGRLARAYRVRADFEQAAKAYEDGNDLGPQIGVPIEIPKSVKGQGCAQALRQFRSCGAARVWAETKYDGERAQIHVQRDATSRKGWRITIFSKSRRDSTLDRAALHPIILEALGLDKGSVFDADKRTVVQNIILDAEMVAFSDELDRIDEFWRIRSLIGSTAMGVRRTRDFSVKSKHEADPETETQNSMASNASDGGTRHLALVFFDVLMLDGHPSLSRPYETRRALLESIVRPRHGYAMLAERSPINLSSGIEDAAAQLDTLWARVISAREEGLMLKAEGGAYGDWKSPWVKVKKDYIKGYGDCVDLAIVGAGWERDRGRGLRVTPSTYTTFYVGVLANAKESMQDPNIRPHFEIYFTASWGLDRAQLEELNFLVKTSNPVVYKPHMGSTSHSALPYTFTLFPGIPEGTPRVLLHTPLLAELCGGGFTKAPGGLFYELRFPRLTKVYRKAERGWEDGVGMEELMRIARDSVGRDRTGKEEEDFCKGLWGKEPGSPSVRCEKRRREQERAWESRLAEAEGRKRKRTRVGGNEENVEDGGKKARARFADGENGSEDERTAGRGERVLWGLKKLGSMTNLAAASGVLVTPPRSNNPPALGHAEAEKAPDKDAMVAVTSTLPNVTGIYPTPPTSGLKRTQRAPVPAPSPDASFSTPASALKALLAESQSLVWFLRPAGAPRPAWCPPSSAFVPPGHRIHGLGAFLGGCTWAQQGVVFVDGEDKMEEGRKVLEGTQRKMPVLLIDLREALSRLAESVGEEDGLDLGTLAACRFGG